jgi:DNA-binding transcriptional LysR family regulator
VTLTSEGEAFLAHAHRILDDVKAALTEMTDIRDLERGEVRLGIPPMMSTYFFPTLIQKFTSVYPNLRLIISGEGAGAIQEKIHQGTLDMGVIAGGHVPETMETRHILREEVVACVPLNHPFVDRSSVSMLEFAQQPLIMFQKGYYQREMLFEQFRAIHEIKPEVVFETNLFSLVKSIVKQGGGISTLLRMVAEDDQEIAAVSFDPPLYLDLMLAWKKGAYLSKANRAFVDFLVEQIQLYEKR